MKNITINKTWGLKELVSNGMLSPELALKELENQGKRNKETSFVRDSYSRNWLSKRVKGAKKKENKPIDKP